MPSSSTSTLKLRPADPFDLIRWLARSQSDPRKAIAELVQNSLDANARRVTIERRRVRRTPALVIRDDGEGIVPELPREAALRAIATNIGHSRKRGLSPRERHDEIVAGKYGIGLLGFWSIGHRMDIRSRVGGGEVWVLRMVEEQERAELLRDRMAFESADTFTEVVISEMHDSAQRLLTGRRLNEYLASELRGMLLATGAALEIRDGLARGLAERTFTVVPRRFVGERLTLPEIAPVDGYPPARIELYLARGGAPAAIEVSCAGTLVANDAAELRGEEVR
jgi:Histidine kinase-, DNA gyrase B-, and HSP90-like ATPase